MGSVQFQCQCCEQWYLKLGNRFQNQITINLKIHKVVKRNNYIDINIWLKSTIGTVKPNITLSDKNMPVEETVSDDDKKERIYNLRKLIKGMYMYIFLFIY